MFAAYDDSSIYAIGRTAKSAIRKARAEAREPNAEFLTARVSIELAKQIERDGWDGMHRSFELDAQGFIVDTTR